MAKLSRTHRKSLNQYWPNFLELIVNHWTSISQTFFNSSLTTEKKTILAKLYWTHRTPLNQYWPNFLELTVNHWTKEGQTLLNSSYTTEPKCAKLSRTHHDEFPVNILKIHSTDRFHDIPEMNIWTITPHVHGSLIKFRESCQILMGTYLETSRP